jgi:tRNA pseudouridine38-40 synthase
LRDRFAWQVWPAVALKAMQDAAHSLIGRHDFAAFGTPPRAGGSSVRSISQADWLQEGADLFFSVTADAFLYHMVRRLVYLQVAVGQGRLSAECVAACVQDPSLALQTLPPGLAPARGLALTEVCYLPNLGRRGIKLESE